MKKSRFPDSLVLIFSIIILAQLLSYVLPHGEFNRVEVPNSSRTMVENGTYQEVVGAARVTLPAWSFLTSLPSGLEKAQDIIFLVFLVGGVIALLRASGAIDAALHGAVARLGKAPELLIGGTLLLFGLGAFTIGMGEEYVPLIPILVTMSLAMKLDAIVAMGMIWVPYGIGWACAGTNPFGVVIAQGLAGVPITSGLATRWVLFFIFLAVGFQHVYAYARKIQKDPSASLVANVDYSTGFEAPQDVRMTGPRILILVIFLAGIVGFVYGVKTWGWYISELNAVFLGIGLLAAIISRMSPNTASQTFIRGASEMTSAALLIGFARTIEVVLSDGQVIDTIIHGIASTLEGTGSYVSAVGMLAVQTVCNFFIPSGSGQAYVTMPIMSPLATLTGVPQQVAVLAYQFGDGFTNMVVPTSALVMGTLALGKIPYTRWVRFIMPLMVKLFGLAIIVLILAVKYGDSWGFTNVG
jgi:uncharacterized ion transporter superfamily protein YfcC